MDQTTKQMYLWLMDPEGYVHGDTKGSTYLTDHDMMKQQGWMLLASPQVTVDFAMPTRDEVRDRAIGQIKETIKEVDAKSHAVKTELQRRINDLLMIGHDSVEDHI